MPEPAASRRDGPRERRFRQLFDEHQRIVLAYLRRRTSEPADAQDALSETFAVAWRRLDDVPTTRDEQVSWLLATARRILANQYRADRRRRALQVRVRVTSPDPVTRDVGDTTAEVALVRQALDRLPDHDREVLRLHAWDGLSYAQIATVLDLTETAVSVRLTRARQRLAAGLEALRDDAAAGT